MKAQRMKALLDTHIFLWWLEDKNRLSPHQQQIVSKAQSSNPLLISDITLWEIATLYQLGRIKLAFPLRDWLDRAAAPPLVESHAISTAIAAQVASLPSSFHRDPADRIIVSTAILLGATL